MDRNEKARQELKEKHHHAMDELKKQHCAWPGCNKQQFMMASMPVVAHTPQGLVPAGLDGKPLEKKEGKEGDDHIGLPIPFCNYHFTIAALGLCAAIVAPGEPGKFSLYAPVDMVKVSEAVLSGMVFSGQLTELMKAKEKNDQRVQELMKERQKKEEEKQHAESGTNEKDQGDQPTDQRGDEQRS